MLRISTQTFCCKLAKIFRRFDHSGRDTFSKKLDILCTLVKISSTVLEGRTESSWEVSYGSLRGWVSPISLFFPFVAI